MVNKNDIYSLQFFVSKIKPLRSICSVSVLFLTLNSGAHAQVLQNLQTEFRRYYKERNKEEIIEGTIYCESSGKITVVVDDPIDQWMIFEKKDLLIFYPVKQRAFRLISNDPVSLPFFMLFLGVAKEDYGLTDMGYRLTGYETNADTLVAYWDPPKQVSKILGGFTLRYVSDRIVYTELKKADGTILVKSVYSNHIHHGAHYYPQEILTVRYILADSTLEKVIYNNLQFGISFPEEVLNFTIPSNLEVEEIKW